MIDRVELDEALESASNRVLRDLPQRRAPPTLEPRVLRELRRRDRLPWWRRSFVHWPLLARSAFVIVCGTLVGITVFCSERDMALGQMVNDAATAPFAWARPAMTAAASVTRLATVLGHAMPPTWLYAGLGFAVLLYLLLFGLGAAAYRSLYLLPSIAGDQS